MLNKTKIYQFLSLYFGIAGDLAKRKLIPALWHLFISGNLPEKFSIVGFARRDWSNDDFEKICGRYFEKKKTTNYFRKK